MRTWNLLILVAGCATSPPRTTKTTTPPPTIAVVDGEGEFVKSPVCLDTGDTHKVTFFANVDSGSYRIRNRYEQQAPGTFTVE